MRNGIRIPQRQMLSRDVDSVDPYGLEGVFLYCPCGREHRCFPCDDPDYDSMVDDVLEYERKDEYW